MERGKSSRSGDVCEIWQQLKQPSLAEKDSSKLESLWKHLQAGTPSQHVHRKPATTVKQQQQQQQQSASRSVASSRQQGALDALKSGLQDGSATSKVAQSLQSPDASVVKATLQQLKAVAQMDAAAAGALPTAKLCKALLRCFEHRTEACRDLAVSSLSSLLQSDPDATLGLLPYVVSVLVERLQWDESRCPSEPSEEVRLQLVQLLSLLLEQAGSAIAAYASEVWSMLTAVLKDSFHEVNMQGCQVAQQLAGILGLRLGAISKELVAALLPLTTHKRYRVRIAAIHAIRDVMHQGAHEMVLEMVAWRDPNLVPIKAFYGDDLKVNFCGKLATDPHVQVRLAFLDMVGNWMLTLRERMDHEARLLPYVLSGLCDDAPAVVQAALQLLDQLGQQYEQEHEKQLEDLMRFADKLEGAAEAQLLQLLAAGAVRYAGSWDCDQASRSLHVADVPAGGDVQQQDGLGAVDHQQATTQAAAAATEALQQQHTLVLPGPFAQRARLGSRLLVRGTLSSLLSALCRELSSWQSHPRAMSARLLLVSLLLSESAAEQHLQVILPALCASASDADAGAAVQSCATVLGCFCSLPRVLDLLEPRMEDWAGQPQRQAAGLTLLCGVLRGAAALQRISSCGGGIRLLKLLTSNDLGLASSSDSSIHSAMLQLAQQLTAPDTLQQLLLCPEDAGGQPLSEASAASTAAASTSAASTAAGREAAGASTAAGTAAASVALPEGGSGHTGDSLSSALDGRTAQGLLEQLLAELVGSSPADLACQAAGGDGAAEEQEWLAAALQRVRL